MSTTTTTPCPPELERSLAQRRAALQSANTIRTKRAELKRQITAGEASVTDALRDRPEWLHTCKVYTLLLAIPGIGEVKAMRWMAQLGISHSKTVGGISWDQRRRLVAFLEER